MRGILVLLLTFSFPLWSQFSELAATDDGRQLYFSSTLTFADMPPSRGEWRLYRVGPEGIQLSPSLTRLCLNLGSRSLSEVATAPTTRPSERAQGR